MNGEFLRGEVYWWKFGDSVGSEQGATRPGLIISSDRGNETGNTVNIVFLTTKPKYLGINVEVNCTERRSWVLCNQIATVDTMRAGSHMGTVSDEEMTRVERGLMLALGIHNESNDEVENNNDEIEGLREEVVSLKHNGLAWKKLYEKALEEIATLRFEADMGKRSAVTPKVEEPVIAEPKVEEPAPSLVDLNTCSESDLRNCGCNPEVIANVIARRPYRKVDDLRFVPGLTNVGYAMLRARVCVSAVPVVKEEPPKVETVEKVNINTATAEELSALTGLSVNMMCAITGYRKRNGEYKSVSELAKVPRLSKNFLERFGDKLTV